VFVKECQDRHGYYFLLVLSIPVLRLLLSNENGARISRPMPKMIAQEVGVLSSSRNGLVYLTANDWALVADKAARVTFRKGQTLVHRGKKSNGVYLILKGTARVQLQSRAVSPEIGAGEICGEMSFLQDAVASANVVANEDLEAYHLDRLTLESLFELFPHLASRFYRSLATNLSRRLRDLIEPAGESWGAQQSS
jgi:signal-transduction protein with cAMP-binding, CBS, and nucleotidyltransferase domain